MPKNTKGVTSRQISNPCKILCQLSKYEYGEIIPISANKVDAIDTTR